MSEKDGAAKYEALTAFPVNFEYTEAGVVHKHVGTGMLLRDYFAAQALPSVLTQFFNGTNWDDYADVAKSAYHVADAMLAARGTTE